MNTGIILGTTPETQPVIRAGDYEFNWTTLGLVAITNRSGETKHYSTDALSRINNSSGMPLAVRSMASAALEWVEQNPLSA